MDDDKKIEIIKKAIASKQGWLNLAASLDGKPQEAKDECIRLLRIIGGDKIIEMPVNYLDDDYTPTTLSINFSDKLVSQLEEYIELFKSSKV